MGPSRLREVDRCFAYSRAASWANAPLRRAYPPSPRDGSWSRRQSDRHRHAASGEGGSVLWASCSQDEPALHPPSQWEATSPSPSRRRCAEKGARTCGCGGGGGGAGTRRPWPDFADRRSRHASSEQPSAPRRRYLMRTLLAEPRALLLDEPFGKLDAALRQDVRAFVFARARARGLPTLLVTHGRGRRPGRRRAGGGGGVRAVPQRRRRPTNPDTSPEGATGLTEVETSPNGRDGCCRFSPSPLRGRGRGWGSCRICST